MSYRIFILPEFKKKVKKLLSKKEREELENFIETKLRFDGDKVGDPLTYTFLREKKILGKRIYYLIYKEIAIILLIEASNKKTQQESINKIQKYLPKYKILAYELYKKINQ